MTIRPRTSSTRFPWTAPAPTARLPAALLLALLAGCGDDRPDTAWDAEPPAGPDQEESDADARSVADVDADVEVERPDVAPDAPPAPRPCRTTVGPGPGLTLRGTVLTPADILPDGEGLGFLLEEVPVIEGRPLRVLVSGDTCNTEQYRQAATRGIDLFLPKPFDFSELRAFLEQRLGETQPE